MTAVRCHPRQCTQISGKNIWFGCQYSFGDKGKVYLLTELNCFQQETSKESSLPGPANENVHSKHFHPGQGKQELYEGSGVYISKVEIQNIHIEMLNKLLGYFFDLQTLASQRESLDDKIVHACTGTIMSRMILAFSPETFRGLCS